MASYDKRVFFFASKIVLSNSSIISRSPVCPHRKTIKHITVLCLEGEHFGILFDYVRIILVFCIQVTLIFLSSVQYSRRHSAQRWCRTGFSRRCNSGRPCWTC